jgi:hypothetical protein
MSVLFTRHVRAALILGMMGLALEPARAVGDELRLESASLPGPLLENGKVNTVIEASAVEPIGDGRRLLLAHDKHPALFVVEAATGRLLGEPITSPRFPVASKLGGPKWEGMARDGEGNYSIIGAHVGKTDEERASKSVLLRFRLKDGDPPTIDDASVIRWDISRSLEAVLHSAGLGTQDLAKRKIEGLAIRESKKADGSPRRELVIGLREPSDKVRAFGVEITTAPSPDAELELRPVFAFEAEPREGVTSQLTSLEYVSALGGFLVVTATEDEGNTFHGNTLWFVPDGQTSRARKVATFEVAMKAEGLAVLGVDQAGARTAVKLLITYDNDPHATKIPSRFQTATLVREPR